MNNPLKSPLEYFISPKSIAIIGASRSPEKVGYQILKNLQDSGYLGRIFPVNPNAEEILGFNCYPTIADIPSAIDLAVIVVPAKIVPAILETCGQKEIKNIIIISANFKESGNKGELLERQINELKLKYHFKILGPNCLGMINSSQNLNVTFAKPKVQNGSVGVISQSGAFCSFLLDFGEQEKIGFSKFISLGNKLDLSELDFLPLLAKDKSTDLIVMYLESISSGEKLLEALREASKVKPVIITIGGITQQGQSAAKSHTGNLTSSADLVPSILKQGGATIPDNFENLKDLIRTHLNFNQTKVNQIAVISNSGGTGVLVVDQIIKNNLNLAELELKSQNLLKEKIEKATSTQNPIDLAGEAKAKDYQIALDITNHDKNVETQIVILTPQTSTEIEKTAEVISSYVKNKKPNLIASFVGGKQIETGIEILKKNHVLHFDDPMQAMRVLSQIKSDLNYRNNNRTSKINHSNKTANSKIRQQLFTDQDYFGLINDYQLPIVPSRSISSPENLGKAISDLKTPIALKNYPSDQGHKAKENRVILNLNNYQEALDTYNQLKKLPGTIIAQSMRQTPLELMIGYKKDPVLGNIIVIGAGGKYVEIEQDVSFVIAGASEYEITQALKETKIYYVAKKIYLGNLEQKLTDIANKINLLITQFPKIKEIDLNPVFVTDHNIEIADIRIIK